MSKSLHRFMNLIAECRRQRPGGQEDRGGGTAAARLRGHQERRGHVAAAAADTTTAFPFQLWILLEARKILLVKTNYT